MQTPCCQHYASNTLPSWPLPPQGQYSLPPLLFQCKPCKEPLWPPSCGQSLPPLLLLFKLPIWPSAVLSYIREPACHCHCNSQIHGRSGTWTEACGLIPPRPVVAWSRTWLHAKTWKLFIDSLGVLGSKKRMHKKGLIFQPFSFCRILKVSVKQSDTNWHFKRKSEIYKEWMSLKT